jgi:hypothetical protein
MLMDKIDQKIQNILRDWHKAHERSMQFNAKELNPGEPLVPMDLYDMALAYDEEKRQLLYLELAYSEKYPHQYSGEQVEVIKKQINKLIHNIRAWQNRQFPSEYRE